MKQITLLVVIYFGMLSITFSQISFSKTFKNFDSSYKCVEIADLNNDGLNDVVIGSGFYFSTENDYYLFIYYQNSRGALEEPIKIKYPDSYPGLNVLKLADVNNDHFCDIIIGYSDSVGIFYQDENGKFDRFQSIFSGYDVDGLDVGDLNHDGLPDFAVCHWNSDFINVFYQTKSDTFNIKKVVVETSGYDELNIADLNNDGLDDIIYMPGQMRHSTVQILFQDAPLGITDSVYLYKYEGYYYPTFQGMGIGDLNNDGFNDIVGNLFDNTMILYQTVENQIGDSLELLESSSGAVEVADLNCDGLNDIITKNTIFEKDNATGKFIRRQISTDSNYNPYSLAVGDINNDNKPDIVSLGFSTAIFMINSSKPTNFDTIDTLLWNLAIEKDTIEESPSYEIIETDTSSICDVERHYTINLMQTKLYERFQGDSVLIRHSDMCGRPYQDTIISSFNYQTKTILKSDTIKTLNREDVIIYNRTYFKDYWSKDTTEIWTALTENKLRIEDISISHDTVIIHVDSVLVKERMIYTKGMFRYFHLYEGIRCESYYVDSLLQYQYEFVENRALTSDTILISKTIERYPSYTTNIFDANSVTFQVFPNPVHNELSINFGNNCPVNCLIKLINSSGATMYQKQSEIVGGQEIINTAFLANGIYYIEIIFDEKRITKRIIKQ